MNAAVRTDHRRRQVLAAVAVVSLLLAFSYLYAFERGPLYCNNGCLIQSPVIDPKTKEFLESELAPIDGWVPLWMYLTETTYMVCNSTHCATYRQTFSGDYITDERIPITGSVGGGGDGGSGGVGGMPPSGGGTVTVGPIGPCPCDPGAGGKPAMPPKSDPPPAEKDPVMQL